MLGHKVIGIFLGKHISKFSHGAFPHLYLAMTQTNLSNFFLPCPHETVPPPGVSAECGQKSQDGSHNTD